MSSDGQSYTPTHAAKKGRRYFYYITGSDRGSSVNTIKRLPADELERRVLSSIGYFLEDSLRLSGYFATLDLRELQLLTSAAKHRAAQLSETSPAGTQDFVSRIVEKIIVEKNELCIFLNREQLCKSLLGGVRPLPLRRELASKSAISSPSRRARAAIPVAVPKTRRGYLVRRFAAISDTAPQMKSRPHWV